MTSRSGWCEKPHCGLSEEPGEMHTRCFWIAGEERCWRDGVRVMMLERTGMMLERRCLRSRCAGGDGGETVSSLGHAERVTMLFSDPRHHLSNMIFLKSCRRHCCGAPHGLHGDVGVVDFHEAHGAMMLENIHDAPWRDDVQNHVLHM